MNLITLTEFQNDFNSSLDKTIDRNYLIENEIREINNFLSYSPIPKDRRSKLVRTIVAKSNQVFKLRIDNLMRPVFVEAVHSYLTLGEFESPKFHHDTEETLKIRKQIVKQAFEFSEYYKWLKELQSLPQKAIKKTTLTHKQKLLALHYLGLDTSKFDNSKVAKILSEILELSEDNTRQYLSYLSAGKNNVRTKSNLETVSKLYNNQGLTDISNNIKKDLEKL